MAGKASTRYPNGVKPTIGDTILGTAVDRSSRGIFTWNACPDCGLERWVARHVECKLCMSCAAKRRRLVGDRNPRWNGGVRQGQDGYRYLTVPEDHPFIEMAGKVFVHGRYRYYIAEHRLAMAQHLGRPLKPWELVHHKGTRFPITDIRNKSDNRIENLELLMYKQEHLPSMSVERTVAALQARITVLEAEMVLLKEELRSSRDGTTPEDASMRCHNTPSDHLLEVAEGIVQSVSNDDENKLDRSSCFCRNVALLRPSPEMAMKNPANSVKPVPDGYGNAELGAEQSALSVETLHGAPLAGEDKVRLSSKGE